MISNGKDQTTKLWDMRNLKAPGRIDERYRGVPSYTFSGWCVENRTRCFLQLYHSCSGIIAWQRIPACTKRFAILKTAVCRRTGDMPCWRRSSAPTSRLSTRQARSTFTQGAKREAFTYTVSNIHDKYVMAYPHVHAQMCSLRSLCTSSITIVQLFATAVGTLGCPCSPVALLTARWCNGISKRTSLTGPLPKQSLTATIGFNAVSLMLYIIRSGLLCCKLMYYNSLLMVQCCLMANTPGVVLRQCIL